jgi:hypothetical protein
MSALRLYVGNRLTDIAVIPDEGWPGMWRVWMPDERVSDMVNLARAKDAGMAALARANGRGLRPGEVARWRTGGGRNAAPYSGSNENSGLGGYQPLQRPPWREIPRQYRGSSAGRPA